jgi:hypothetical protein
MGQEFVGHFEIDESKWTALDSQQKERIALSKMKSMFTWKWKINS